jgi:hypothetical protein
VVVMMVMVVMMGDEWWWWWWCWRAGGGVDHEDDVPEINASASSQMRVTYPACLLAGVPPAPCGSRYARATGPIPASRASPAATPTDGAVAPPAASEFAVSDHGEKQAAHPTT